MSGSKLTATIEQAADGDQPGEHPMILQIVNTSEETIELLNPDIGRPPPDWPFSTEAYRASLLMSYGYLTVSVVDEFGDEVEPDRVETWATPILRPRLALLPGDSTSVVIPLGRFFPLSPGHKYRVSAEYGDNTQKVPGGGTIEVKA
jgi:hypothetical protein